LQGPAQRQPPASPQQLRAGEQNVTLAGLLAALDLGNSQKRKGYGKYCE